MYDSVYESGESPPDTVIEDDDCLDGWFIDQKRKQEKYKKDLDAQKFTSNKKIAKAPEVFVVASSGKEAEYVESLNSLQAQHIKKQRMQTVENNKTATDLDFMDVAIDRQAQESQALFNKFKGK
jgi:plasmid replication initiation protein